MSRKNRNTKDTDRKEKKPVSFCKSLYTDFGKCILWLAFFNVVLNKTH